MITQKVAIWEGMLADEQNGYNIGVSILQLHSESGCGNVTNQRAKQSTMLGFSWISPPAREALSKFRKYSQAPCHALYQHIRLSISSFLYDQGTLYLN